MLGNNSLEAAVCLWTFGESIFSSLDIRFPEHVGQGEALRERAQSSGLDIAY
jgi:hypothetical protein